MNVIAVNGSPRKTWNTATLLRHALDGASSRGAAGEMVHLYDLDYKGCISCFACKLKGGKSYGRCAVSDGLRPVLDKIESADGLVLGSPVYLGMVSGMMRCFLERLVFQYIVYDAQHSHLFKRKIRTGLIYTMNVPQERVAQMGYEEKFKGMEMSLGRVFGACESLFVTDTCQFDDYAKYESSLFNAEEKAARRREVFPEDCRKAFAMGARLAAPQ
ncbi:MAG TPA: flavodoxin family protein [Chitinivibrionales bacterium]|nr:flavodoxin family protein [Chitinivibrionales bacterium]